MTSETKIQNELCTLLECNPRELPEAISRLELLEICGGAVTLCYHNREEGLQKNRVMRDCFPSFFRLGLDSLRKIGAQNRCGEKLYVHTWPEGLQEIIWSGNPAELFANLARFAELRNLRLKNTQGEEITIPAEAARRLSLLSADKLDVRCLEGGGNLTRLELHAPEHFGDFPYLEYLHDFTGTKLKTADGIRNMPNLRRLVVKDSPLVDISALSVLGDLADPDWIDAGYGIRYITLTGGYIHDITPLSGLTMLETLDIRDNLVEDIAPLSGLNLYYLDVSHNPLESVTALEGHTNLESLNLTDTFVRDISPLEKLPKLRELSLNVEQLRDRRQLNSLAGLETLNGMEFSEAIWYYKVNG